MVEHGFTACAFADGVRVAAINDARGANLGAHIVRQLLYGVNDTAVVGWLRAHMWMPVHSGEFEAAVQFVDGLPTNYAKLGAGNGDACEKIMPGLGYALTSSNDTHVNLHEAIHLVSHGIASQYPAAMGHDSFSSTVGKATKRAEQLLLYNKTAHDSSCTEPSCLVTEFVQRVVEDRLGIQENHRSADYARGISQHTEDAALKDGIDTVVHHFGLEAPGYIRDRPFGLANYSICASHAGDPDLAVQGVEGHRLFLLCTLGAWFYVTIALAILCMGVCCRKYRRAKHEMNLITMGPEAHKSLPVKARMSVTYV